MGISMLRIKVVLIAFGCILSSFGIFFGILKSSNTYSYNNFIPRLLDLEVNNSKIINVKKDIKYHGYIQESLQPAQRHSDDKTTVMVKKLMFDDASVKVYIPSDRIFNGSAVFYIHGGGWVSPSLRLQESVSAQFARLLKVPVIAVDYRLAPSYPFPAAIDDCFTALKYLMRNAMFWQVDPSRIIVAGESAGGHLTAALSLRWRRQVIEKQRNGQSSEGLHPIRLQMLIYPVLQFVNVSTTSYLVRRFHALTKKSMVRMWTWFLFGKRGDDDRFVASLCANNQTTRATRQRYSQLFDFGDDYSVVTAAQRAEAARIRATEPQECDPNGDPSVESTVLPIALQEEASPLMTKSLADLPPAYVASCEFDVLRDDALLYVKRLRNASPPLQVEHKHYPCEHGSMTLDIISDFAEYIRHHPVLIGY